MNDLFTDITKNVGRLIAKINNNNLLLQDLTKTYNPTFVDIIDDLNENGEETLLTLLLIWYNKKCGTDYSDFKKLINELDPSVSKSTASCDDDDDDYSCGYIGYSRSLHNERC